MVDILPRRADEFLQLYVHAFSVVCVAGSEAVFAVYYTIEGPVQTAGAGRHMETGVPFSGLGVLFDHIKNDEYCRLPSRFFIIKIFDFQILHQFLLTSVCIYCFLQKEYIKLGIRDVLK